MPEIQKSVGVNGANADDDVIIVQLLLNTVAPADGGANPILDIDGWYRDKTATAIRRFQTIQLQGLPDLKRIPNGIIQPGSNTISVLNQRANEAWRTGSARTLQPELDPEPDPATQARKDSHLAQIWGMAGMNAIVGLIAHLGQHDSIAGYPDPIVAAALRDHFHITAATPKTEALRLLGIIRNNFNLALVELSSGTHFRSVSRRQMYADFNGSSDYQNPGYTQYQQRICWSPLFHPLRTTKPGYDWAGDGYGPKARAAMVLHEPIHFVDLQADGADAEVYERSSKYTSQSADKAVHCASCYPSFAAHVEERSTNPMGPRYGAGRHQD